MRTRWPALMVDPPYKYRSATNMGGAGAKYPRLTMPELARMPIEDWAEENAHLYLWFTNAMQEEACELAKAWGFKRKTILTWRKIGRLGAGYYFRNDTEHMLFGVRGRLGTLRNDMPTLFEAPRGGHSVKPKIAFDYVEEMSPGPRLEVFARRQRFGWDAWGNEGVVCAPGLPTPEEMFGRR